MSLRYIERDEKSKFFVTSVFIMSICLTNILSYNIGKAKRVVCYVDTKHIKYLVNEDVYEQRIRYRVVRMDTKCGSMESYESTFLYLRDAESRVKELNKTLE